jgi:hypothetical protein
VSDENEEVLRELRKFVDSNLDPSVDPNVDPNAEIRASPREPVAVELDDATIDLARQAARPPWYASWVPGAVMLAGPGLFLMAGTFGGQDSLIAAGIFSFLFFGSCGRVLVVAWVALFARHISHVSPIRKAIRLRRAWALTGPVQQWDGIIAIDNQALMTLRRVQIPDWWGEVVCTAVVTDANVRMVIKITAPDGRLLLPVVSATPRILQLPAIIVSILIGLAFTAAFNAQSQLYNDAAARLHDIEAASQCTSQSRPGDACWKWLDGTVEDTGVIYSSSGSSPGPVRSSCFVMLRWGSAHQEGEIRTDNGNCQEQLSASFKSPMPASIQLVRDYAVQIRVGTNNYRTDRWPPYGDTVFTLALIFQMATILWLAWPIVHVAIAVVYRVRRAVSAPAGGTPSPPGQAPLSVPNQGP